MQGIPDVALADMWILSAHGRRFAAAPDSLLFGAQSDLARDAAARLDRRAARLARQVLAVDRYGLMERFVGDYVRENPADGGDGGLEYDPRMDRNSCVRTASSMPMPRGRSPKCWPTSTTA